jgi:arylsulfatase A-like enzyme
MQPNVVLIVLDTARAQNFSCLGYQKVTSPRIDQLAEEGVLYRNCIAPAPWTLPSHASLFTGQFPSVHGAHGAHLRLDDRFPTLAQVLRGLGYSTLGISSNVWVSEAFGLARGFDTFFKTWQRFQDDTTTARVMRARGDGNLRPRLNALLQSIPRNAVPKTLLNLFYLRVLWRRSDAGAERTYRELRRSMASLSRPFFVFLNYMEPHAPYNAPGEYKFKHLPSKNLPVEHAHRMIKLSTASKDFHMGELKLTPRDFELMRALYDGEISYSDYRVGQVLDYLDHSGVLDDTIVIVTSDHGENIGEHALMAHRFSVNETLLRVPLIVRYPAAVEAGQQVQEYVQLTDIFPTILRLLGVRPGHFGLSLPGRAIDPPSLCARQAVPVVAEYIGNGYTAEANDPTFDFESSRYCRTYKALYRGGFKLIMASDGSRELYELGSDPEEGRNLAEERRDLVGRLSEHLAEWELSNPSSSVPASVGDQELDAIVEERLRALGYLG